MDFEVHLSASETRVSCWNNYRHIHFKSLNVKFEHSKIKYKIESAFKTVN